VADSHHDEVLRQAWSDFCDRLKGASELVFRPEVPSAELDRAWGIRYLSRYISKALNEVLEFGDPLFPQFWIMQTPTNKTFGDNPDCTYLTARIDGSLTYRIVGNRGTVSWVRFNIAELGPSGMRGTMIGDDELETEWDGSFTVHVGPEPPPEGGNWLRAEPGPARVFIRQFFGNWDKEEPMVVRIERVGAEGETPERLTAERVATALREAGDYIECDSNRWFRWMEYYRQWPNVFVEGRPDWAGDSKQAERNAGRWLHFCHFELEPDEALLIEFTPPECFMWIYELNNYWMNSTDYRYHFSSLNDRQAVAEDDGSYRIAVCSEDPGIPNWLDTNGHMRGQVIKRWVDAPANDNPAPGARVVKLADLERSITPEERLEQRRRLKIGVDRRFGYAQ
jgi:hypothetical protein